jgi:hypothetical protein
MTDGIADAAQQTTRERLGLFEGFEGYRTAAHADYIRVLREGLVVIDSNVLLDLYRYGASARADLLKALKALGDRLYVPHQAVREFWRNREKLLKDPGGTLALQQTIENSEKQLKESINNWTNQRSHQEQERVELEAVLTEAFQSLKDKIRDLSEDETAGWARDTSIDEVLTALDDVLKGRVGKPMSAADNAEAIAEAKRRNENKIPPGYLDAKKEADFSTGDYIVWEETLREAETRGVDVLFVSRDTKEDWVRREGGENRGPRIELVQEMRTRAAVSLFMRTPADLLKLANESLNIEVREESVTNADRLSRELAASERRYLEDERWWKDSTDWDVAAVHWFLAKLLEEHPKYAELLDFASVNDRTIDVEVLEFFGMSPSPRSLKEFERVIVEMTDATAREGLVPAQALPILEKVSRRRPGEPTRVVGYSIRPEIRELVNLVVSAQVDAEV